MTEICVISRESYINARIIKIRTTELSHIEETIKLANNGISLKVLSHARISDGYQIILDSDADGRILCQHLIDALLRLPGGSVVIERINC